MTLSNAEANDTVHAILCALMCDSEKLFDSREHIRNYVARAIINRSITEHQRPDRAWRSSPDIDTAVLVEPNPRDSPDQGPLEMERHAVLRQAIARLPKRSFEIVKLRFYCGFSFREIGELLGLPISTLKSREESALTQLRTCLKQNGLLD